MINTGATFHDQPVWQLELDDLAKGSPVREAIEKGLEEWYPNHNEDGRITGYEDWIVRLEGEFQLPAEVDAAQPWVFLELPTDMASAEWTRLENVAKALAKELR